MERLIYSFLYAFGTFIVLLAPYIWVGCFIGGVIPMNIVTWAMTIITVLLIYKVRPLHIMYHSYIETKKRFS